ncbi:universal stress protein [Candidatus Nitrospira bockiana]
MRLKRLLIPTDFSTPAEAASQFGLRVAEYCRAEVLFLHVVEFEPGLYPYPLLNDLALQQIREQVGAALGGMVAAAEGRGIPATGRHEQGIASERIIETATVWDADLIVVGTRGRTGLDHVLLGSTAERVVKGAPCPVVTVRGDRDTSSIQRILVPLDLSDCSLEALEYAAQTAREFKAALRMLHVPDWASIRLNFSPAELADHERVRGEIETRLGGFVQAFGREGIPASFTLRNGPPPDAILEEAGESRSDLIVMGTHGRRGVSRLLFGSVTEAVLRRSSVPVLTLRSARFAGRERRLVPQAAGGR